MLHQSFLPQNLVFFFHMKNEGKKDQMEAPVVVITGIWGKCFCIAEHDINWHVFKIPRYFPMAMLFKALFCVFFSYNG